jgi:hypothetical protein
MMVNLYDYEVLARQRRDEMMAEAARQHLARSLRQPERPRRVGLRALVSALRGRLGTAEQATVSTRTA